MTAFTARHRILTVVAVHLLLLAVLTSALYGLGVMRYLPADDNLGSWDVYWYNKIRAEGYSYSETAINSAAFFPLFPYFWRLTHLEPMAMGLLNYGLFLAAFAWLAQQLRLAPRWALLLLSTPMLLFMAVPYTEALFFCFGALLLVGLLRERTDLFMLGLFGCGLTRSASTMFAPALLFMVLLLAVTPGKARLAWRYGVGGLLALAASIGVVALIQGSQIGEPFGFIKAHKHWGHHFGLPQYPLTDAPGVRLLWLDGLSIALGTAAAAACAWLLLCWWRRHRQPMPAVPPAVVFALGYFVSVTVFIVFYQQGDISNAARYLFAPPFLIVLVHYLSIQPAWSLRRYVLIGMVTLLFWQVFGAYTNDFANFSPLQALWYFGCTTAYLLGYLLLRQVRWQGELLMLLYTFNIVVHFYFLECFVQYYLIE